MNNEFNLFQIKLLYRLKHKNPNLFDDILPSTMKKAILNDALTILPLRSQFGRRIMLLDFGKFLYSAFSHFKNEAKYC